MDSKEKGDTF